MIQGRGHFFFFCQFPGIFRKFLSCFLLCECMRGCELTRHGPGTFVPCGHRSAVEIPVYRGTPGGLEL